MAEPADRFELIEQLGKGGMGVVWKARDKQSGAVVALKMVRADLADDADYVARFEREVELARRVSATNVVRVLGYGRSSGVPYLSMEYVPGATLRELIATNGAMPWEQVWRIAFQLTLALAAVHSAGITHRDVKPSNVIITPSGVAKLSDFGIAKAGDLTRLTSVATFMGTAAYMAPEGEASARSDLYALGCVLYEALTGVVPFPGESQQEVLLSHMQRPPNLNAVPLAARPLLAWLLAKDPQLRPADGNALLAALSASPPAIPMVTEARAGEARRPSSESPERVSQGSPRRHRPARWPAYVAVAGGMAVVLVVAGVIVLGRGGGTDAAEPSARINTGITQYPQPEPAAGAVFAVGPIMYTATDIEIAFSVRIKCAAGQAGLSWRPDLGDPATFITTSSGQRMNLTAATGIAARSENLLACDTVTPGLWVFASPPPGESAESFTYDSGFEFSMPSQNQAVDIGGVRSAGTYVVGQHLKYAGSNCLNSRVLPSDLAAYGPCIAPSSTFVLDSGAVMLSGEWWRVKLADGRVGWIETGVLTAENRLVRTP